VTVRVASLLRLSTKKQAKRQGETEPDIPAQRQAIPEFLAGRAGWTLVKEYVEAGVSAFRTSADDRDILQDAIREAKAGGFDVLLVWKSDRLSRKSEEYPAILAALHRCGVEIWSVVDSRPLSMDTQSDKLLRLIEGWLGESESVNTSIRVSSRMRQLAQQGRWTGSKVPFGYTLVARKDGVGEPLLRGGRPVRDLVPHPTNAPVVREAYRRYAAGDGYLKLAEWLNTTRVQTYTGALWTIQTVQDIITNPLYAGLIMYGRTEAIPGTKRRRSAGEPLLVKGEHEPLVHPELWEQAQQLRQARASVPLRQRSADYTLVGVLRCGACGGPMGGCTRRFRRVSGEAVSYPVYLCINHKASKSCLVTSYIASEVEASFLAAVEALALPGGLRELLELQAAEHQKTVHDQLAVRRQIGERLGEIEGALGRLDRAYLEKGTISDEEYVAKKREYQAEQRTLTAQLHEPTPVAPSRDFEALAVAAREIRANWEYLTPEERKSFALSLSQAYEVRVLVHTGAQVELVPIG